MEYLRGKVNNIQYVIPQDGLVKVENKEILVLWDGANAGEIIYSKKGYLSSTMAIIEPLNHTIQKEFLYFLLKNHEKKLKDFAGGTTIPHLDPDVLLHSSFFILHSFINSSNRHRRFSHPQNGIN